MKEFNTTKRECGWVDGFNEEKALVAKKARKAGKKKRKRKSNKNFGRGI